jgi:hypothetical protein
MTMSISCTPVSTAAATSASLTAGRGPPGRERGGDRADRDGRDGRTSQLPAGHRDRVRIHADCRDRRDRRVSGVWLAGLGTQPGDLVRRVGPFERGQVHYRHGGVQGSQFGVAFDGPGCQRGGSLLASS